MHEVVYFIYWKLYTKNIFHSSYYWLLISDNLIFLFLTLLITVNLFKNCETNL